ncbi:ArsR/SmtB family transcription factor [Actinoplanes sp. NPDC051494]|uniref:ArsR/SmtB family transcription factor n=1 Tax=Actinoplanes sp. NPDC051494 TaxID=3363907 RepID=UPI00379A5583
MDRGQHRDPVLARGRCLRGGRPGPVLLGVPDGRRITPSGRVFQALADGTRRDILRRVVRAEQSVSALAEHYPMSFAAVQRHVAVLERAALVVKQRRGREQVVHADLGTVRRAARLLDAYEELWRHRVRGIEQILSEEGP